MGHWMAKKAPSLHVGMLMILTTTVPLLKACLANDEKASNVFSS
jgi:hypothetical protein